MKKSQLLKTDSIEELAEFWNTHDLTDFEDELEEVAKPLFVRKPTIEVPLTSREAEAVERITQAEGRNMADFTHYWSSAENDIDAAAASSTPLDYTVDSRFTRRGVRIGDSIYVLTARKGKLFLVGKLEVGKIVHSDAKAEALLGYHAWPGPTHLIASHCTPVQLVELPPKVVARLRFISRSGRTTVKFDSPGIIDRQTLRGVRSLEPKSAAELDEFLPEMEPFSPDSPSVWREEHD
jgi:hypothetical protein